MRLYDARGRLTGLSPRVRGNRHVAGASRGGARSIPACAGEPAWICSPLSCAQVYPRVCGGTDRMARRARTATGLSPRVRGNHRAVSRGAGPEGSIPACAGEPWSGLRGPTPTTVYPRVCGGTAGLYDGTNFYWGLSPRVRGNRSSRPSAVPRRGSIPACAGEPRRCSRSGGQREVYPRVCGGTPAGLTEPQQAQGLSPRVRGNRIRHLRATPAAGSIPACAGEPYAIQRPGSCARVYPRVCGGTANAFQLPYSGQGLSPRVRGNLHFLAVRDEDDGSIPACAGEPTPGSMIRPSRTVYPRVCGGTPLPIHGRTALGGLSPRVRGNPGPVPEHVDEAGSIPACAGEPRGRARTGCPSRVYPRVCGGTGYRASNPANGEGLSPRVRGNPPTWRRGTRRARVYPRVCGGTSPGRAGRAALRGLSPRVRGNHADSYHRIRLEGSIPACAGEPGSVTSTAAGPRVYPRVCGGTARGWPRCGARPGLSPRVRGNHPNGGRPAPCRGSIPACAGEPRAALGGRQRRGVYPRVCGGTADKLPGAGQHWGLSPRVRGNRYGCGRRMRRMRSIPACAGEPPTPPRRRSGRGVYPRVCGGTEMAAVRAASVWGLSPRVRGNHRCGGQIPRANGSIPACAGEPPMWRTTGGPRRVYPRVCGGTPRDGRPPARHQVYPRVCGGT